MDFGAPKRVHSIFLLNDALDYEYQKMIGQTHVRMGNDRAEFTTASTVVKEEIVEGGFFELNNVSTWGQYLTLRRD